MPMCWWRVSVSFKNEAVFLHSLTLTNPPCLFTLSPLADFMSVTSADFGPRHRDSLTERSGPPKRKPQAGLGEPGAALSAGAEQQRLTKTEGTQNLNLKFSAVPLFDIKQISYCMACYGNSEVFWETCFSAFLPTVTKRLIDR